MKPMFKAKDGRYVYGAWFDDCAYASREANLRSQAEQRTLHVYQTGSQGFVIVPTPIDEGVLVGTFRPQPDTIKWSEVI